jgi:hypothetical protein
MFKLFLITACMLFFVSGVFAQSDDWHASTDGALEYNCATYETLQEALGVGGQQLASAGDQLLARAGTTETVSVHEYIGAYVLLLSEGTTDFEVTLDQVLADIAATCGNADTAATGATSVPIDSFSVVVNGNANLRSCAGTNCDVVGQAAPGELLTVVSQDNDWYEVQVDDGTAFIASFLVTRGPDEVISVDEAYFDARTGCTVAFDINRGDMDINIIIAGESRDDVVVDLYRPNESNPLSVEGQLDKTFIDTGDPYIHQYYSWNVGYPNGLYNLELSMDGNVSRLAWELETRGDYNIFVYCE